VGTYSYKAVNAAGQVVDGELVAVSEAEALEALRQQHLAPLRLRANGATGGPRPGSRRGVRRRDITHVTLQLAALLRAGLTVDRALTVLTDQAGTAELSRLLGDLSRQVREGQPLSAALAAYPQHFSELFRQTVRAGELGSALTPTLTRLGEGLEKDEELRDRLKSAMTYPAIMLGVMILSVVVLLTFVVPRFTGVFAEMGSALPLPTRILLTGSHWLAHGWWAWLTGALGLTALLWSTLRSPACRLGWDRLLFRLPWFGVLARELALTRFAFTLGMLLRNGVPMAQALGAAREVSGNSELAAVLARVRQEVQAGTALSAALRHHPRFFPMLAVSMAGAGEQSGNLAEMIENCGHYYRREADMRIRTLSTLLEPAMILGMGVLVGFVVMAMLLPIFQMSTAVR
jgi:general secretion pathway protein F